MRKMMWMLCALLALWMPALAEEAFGMTQTSEMSSGQMNYSTWALPDGQTRVRIDRRFSDGTVLTIQNDTAPAGTFVLDATESTLELACDEGQTLLLLNKTRYGENWYLSWMNFAWTAGPNWLAGPDTNWENGGETLYFGDHPYGDFTQLDLSHLPDTLEDALETLNQANWAVVNNPDPADRLHLRDRKSKSGRSLGKFYNGTPVYVESIEGDWAYVRIGQYQHGYMMRKYLAFGEDMNAVTRRFHEGTWQHPEGLVPFFDEPNAKSEIHSYIAAEGGENWDKGETGWGIIGLYGDKWLIVMNEEGIVRYAESRWLGEPHG